MASIPASQIVQVIPSVIGTGGTALALNGVILDQSLTIPTGSVLQFGSALAVGNYFGLASNQYSLAQIYFAGYINGTQYPTTIFFAPFAATARAAWVGGGSVASMSLATLQAITGTLAVTIDGVVKSAASLNLATASSFSAAASMIATALTLTNGQTCTYNSQTNNFQITSGTVGTGAVVTGSIATTTLTVTAVTSGTLQVGQTISGVGVTSGTTITALVTGTGGIGTYTVSTSQTVASTTISANASTIGYVSGTAAASLMLTQATGAVLSQGWNADTPTTAMANLVAATQNWSSYMTSWEPVTATKLLFAKWNSLQNDRWAYVAWDSDVLACTSNATTTFGNQAALAAYDGVMPIGGDPAVAAAAGVTLASLVMNVAAFTMGMIASVNFSQTNGRITGAFKSQAGLGVTVNSQQSATNLIGNGYNYYGAYATAATNFNFLYPGSITGQWVWLDPYIDQIYMNAQFQLSLMTLLTSVGSVPYTAQGYTLIRSAMQGTINSMLNFGAIRSGVALSTLQQAQINNLAGVVIAPTIQNQGYYLQILDPGAQVRGNRGTPVINFIYADGGAIQYISVASIDAQ